MNPCVIPAPQPPVIPALLLRHSRAPFRHSREGGNPRPGPGGKSPTVSRSTTPVIPAPPSSSFPRRREPTSRIRGQVTHSQPERHPRHSREGGNPRPRLSQQLSHPQRANTPVIPALLLRHSREGGNPRPRPGGKSPTVSRSATPVIPALLLRHSREGGNPRPRSRGQVTHSQPERHPRHSRTPSSSFPRRACPGPRSGAGTHGPDQGASHPQSAGAPPPSFPHSFFVIPAKAGTHGPDQGASHPQSAGAPPPSFPHSFFVIPRRREPTRPDYPNNSPTLSGRTPPSFTTPSLIPATHGPITSHPHSHPRPAPFRHSREGGNPRPDQVASHYHVTTIN